MSNEDKIKIVSFNPLSLYTDGDNDNQYATLTWSIRMGYPRITVYTENHRDRKEEFSFDKLITAPFDTITVNMFINNLKTVIASKEPIKLAMKCYNVKYVNNEKTNDITLQATAICGKDSSGVIYLAAISEGKKKVKFELLPSSKWHKMVGSNGDEITDKAKLSAAYAKAYYDRLKSLMDINLTDSVNVKYVDKK